jgi:CsoR family transcriptional regulator, copper-sensing transcriptional repressor
MFDSAADDPHKRTLTRLRRIAGQVEGIARMVEEDRYCMDVLTQVAAAQAALAKVGEEVLKKHLETCVVQAVESGDPKERERVVAELVDLLSRSSSLLR